MSMQTMGAMWLYDNSWGVRNAEKRQNKSFTYRFLVVWNYFIILAGSLITVSLSNASLCCALQLKNCTDPPLPPLPTPHSLHPALLISVVIIDPWHLRFHCRDHQRLCWKVSHCLPLCRQLVVEQASS